MGIKYEVVFWTIRCAKNPSEIFWAAIEEHVIIVFENMLLLKEKLENKRDVSKIEGQHIQGSMHNSGCDKKFRRGTILVYFSKEETKIDFVWVHFTKGLRNIKFHYSMDNACSIETMLPSVSNDKTIYEI